MEMNDQLKMTDMEMLKSLLVVAQVRAGYEPKLSKTFDGFIESCPDLVNVRRKTSFIFFTDISAVMTSAGDTFYQQMNGKVTYVKEKIKNIVKDVTKGPDRRKQINAVIESKFSCTIEYLIARDILHGTITWDDHDMFEYPMAEVPHYFSKRFKRNTNLGNKRATRTRSCTYSTNIDTYDVLDFWDMYFIMEMVSEGYIDMDYMHSCDDFSDYSIEPEPVFEPVDMEPDPAFEDAVMESSSDWADAVEDAVEDESSYRSSTSFDDCSSYSDSSSDSSWGSDDGGYDCGDDD